MRSGVVIASQVLGIAEVVDELLLIWASDADEWVNRITYLFLKKGRAVAEPSPSLYLQG
jgi:hypothetical protein